MPLAVVVVARSTCCCNMYTTLWRFLFTIWVYLTHLICFAAPNSHHTHSFQGAAPSYPKNIPNIFVVLDLKRAICLWTLFTCTRSVFDFLPMVFHLFSGLCLRLTSLHVGKHKLVVFLALWYGKYFTNKLKPSGISLAHRSQWAKTTETATTTIVATIFS